MEDCRYAPGWSAGDKDWITFTKICEISALLKYLLTERYERIQSVVNPMNTYSSYSRLDQG
jgi:hypothetical protein